MANIIKLLNLLKWNTDEKHPISQEKLRELSPEANECMGYKSTFKRQLLSIADTYNEGKNEDKWRIIFPGYKLYKTNSNHYYTGPIFYKHEITDGELHFLVNQIHGISFEQKAKLVLKLIRNLGSKYYANSDETFLEKINYDDLESMNFDEPNTISNLNEIIQTREYHTSLSKHLYHNLHIIEDAIRRKRLLSFIPVIIDKNGKEQHRSNEKYFYSPYCIIFYKGNYWMIGNRRFDKPCIKEGRKYNKYADTIDFFRIDKLSKLSIAENSYELHAKTEFINFSPVRLNLFSSKIHAFKENIKIKGTDITNEYGFIEFEILWNNFPSPSIQDYSFIFDTFGYNFSIHQEEQKTIASVYAHEDCFIDWALTNINKIKILDTSPNSTSIKYKIKNILLTGLSNL